MMRKHKLYLLVWQPDLGASNAHVPQLSITIGVSFWAQTLGKSILWHLP